MTEEASSIPATDPSPLDPTTAENLVAFFEEAATKPLSLRALARELAVTDEQRSALKTGLATLVEEGRIVETRDGRFGSPAKMNLVVGRLSCHANGFGFVIAPDPKQKDLYVPARKIGDAMHGDLVVARREPTTGRKTEGRVIRTLKRARNQVVGTFESGRSFGFVVPLDERIGYQVYVPVSESSGAADGQIVCAEITSYPEGKGRRNPEGRIVEVLGDADDPRIDVEVIIREYGLLHEFPAEVVAEAEQIATEVAESDVEGRTDFRELSIVTIDGENAKDFDDAVHVEKLENGNYQLAVHIADVGAYVAVGSAIDREAQRRTTSVYFPDRVVPMLPERLSNEICSLKPGVDRLVQSVVMEITAEGRTVNYEFHDGVIRSAERMTYRDVAAVLEGTDESLLERYAGHVDHFKLMGELCDVLRRYRSRRGSIDFDLPEPELLINLRGVVEDIFRSERNQAHRLIEEFMIRANEVVASHLEWEDVPTLFRVHEGPDLDKVEGFRQFIGGLGLQLGGGKKPKPADFQRLVESLEGQPGERVLIYLMLRTMKQARYQEDNIGHFGLASERYGHFTSPIRRYPDLVMHRVLRKDRDSKAQADFDLEALQGDLRRIGAHSSEQERTAEEAERRYVSWKTVQFMADKVGDTFDAFVTGVHAYGFFVELEPYFVDGLVHISSLDDDYYHFDDRQHSLRGDSSGRTIALGNKVRVQLAKLDRGRRRLDFALVEGPVESGITPTKLPIAAEESGDEPTAPRRRKRRRRRRRAPVAKSSDGAEQAAAGETAEASGEEPKPAARGRRRRTRKTKASGADRADGAEGKATAREGKSSDRQRSSRDSRSGGEKKAATRKRRTTKTAQRGTGGSQDDKRASAKSGDARAPRSRRRGSKTDRGRSDRSRTDRAAATKSETGSGAQETTKPAEVAAKKGQPARVNPYLTDL